MDREEEQDDEQDQVSQTQAHQVLHAEQDNRDWSSRPDHNSPQDKELRLSPIQFEDVRDGSDSVPCVSKIWKDDLRQERVTNGMDTRKTTEGEDGDLEDEFEVVPEISFLKDVGATSSPSRNFKSSYAKSLADSYRRASLPVVVSSPKGQFYFKNEEFLSLNSSTVKHSGFSHAKFLSLDSNTNKPSSLPSSEALSLPTILDIVPEPQEQQEEVGKSAVDPSYINFYSQLLLDENVYVSYERLCNLSEKGSDRFSLQDWRTVGSVTTSDGKKLVKLSGKYSII